MCLGKFKWDTKLRSFVWNLWSHPAQSPLRFSLPALVYSPRWGSGPHQSDRHPRNPRIYVSALSYLLVIYASIWELDARVRKLLRGHWPTPDNSFRRLQLWNSDVFQLMPTCGIFENLPFAVHHSHFAVCRVKHRYLIREVFELVIDF
jgi:hypothetical protein